MRDRGRQLSFCNSPDVILMRLEGDSLAKARVVTESEGGPKARPRAIVYQVRPKLQSKTIIWSIHSNKLDRVVSEPMIIRTSLE